MLTDLLHSALSNTWTAFLVVLFFGGSIFVHELGHFLAARRRGVHVERFSIGFGPAIWSHRGKDGVEYQVAWIPLGGYVLLPQLAELSAVEGKSQTRGEEFVAPPGAEKTDPARVLPPVDYASKVIVFVAGATFNVLFAFALACVLTVIGVPERNDTSSNRIGYISPTLDMADGTKIPSPASLAGLRVGDTIVAIDGMRVSNWNDLRQILETSAGRDAAGNPEAAFDLRRDGKPHRILVSPRLAGDEKYRQVGILPAFPLLVYEVAPGSSAQKAGFRAGDEITHLDHVLMLNNFAFAQYLESNRSQPVQAEVERAGKDITVTIAPGLAKPNTDFGLSFSTGFHYTHPSPFRQIWDPVLWTVRTLAGLINPRSDIGLSKLAGPVGIVHMFIGAAESGLRSVFMFTILLNMNLAILNLLPVPVLDGGQILFATVSRLRGRPLPLNFIATTQSVFLVLIFSMFIYISFFNVRQWAHESQMEHIQATSKP